MVAQAALQVVGSTSNNPPTMAEIVQSLQKLRAELVELFPEREAVITQLVYALLTRHHMLVFGTYGTGKSHLVKSFFGAFTDANFFSIELTKSMSESSVFGIPNPKIMREEGRIVHERAGTLLDSHFAELDELFDANDFLLRALLGVLNERRFNRGQQRETLGLHTVFASTNADPKQELKRSPSLGAVIDRFLFRTNVQYLATDEGRGRMYANFMASARPSVQIPYADIDRLATAVTQVPLVDFDLIHLYDLIVQGFRKESNVVISDRRACETMRIVQANAVLHGRTEILPEDFMAPMWIFCEGQDTATQDKYKSVAEPLIAAMPERQKPDMVQTQALLLQTFEERIPSVTNFVTDQGTQVYALSALVDMRRACLGLYKEVGAVIPSSVTITAQRALLLEKIDTLAEKLGLAIDGEVVE